MNEKTYLHSHKIDTHVNTDTHHRLTPVFNKHQVERQEATFDESLHLKTQLLERCESKHLNRLDYYAPLPFCDDKHHTSANRNGF